LLEDLGKERKKNANYTMAQIGVWMNKYAKKIDQLSVLNVDPEVVQYGANVADHSARKMVGPVRPVHDPPSQHCDAAQYLRI
jgi:hypothetical protein